MPPKQDTLDQFLQLAPGFMNTMANTMATMQAATTQIQADLDANAQQVNAALVNLDTASLTQTVARLGLPPARPYNPRQPHKWASDLYNEILRWSQAHADSLTTDPVTNAANVPPTLRWATDQDAGYLQSRDMFLYL